MLGAKKFVKTLIISGVVKFFVLHESPDLNVTLPLSCIFEKLIKARFYKQKYLWDPGAVT
jgi:hypothetical protein